MDVLKDLLKDKPVVIFSKSSSCFSYTVKCLIKSFGAHATIYELDQLPNGQEIEMALKQFVGRQDAVPTVFIGQKLVGGTNELNSLHLRGQLVPMLIEAGAIWL